MKAREKKNSELDDFRQRKIRELEMQSALQKKIGELNARLAAIVESSDDAIIGKDLNGIITSWNKGAERIYGYTAEEAIGRPVSLLAAAGQAPEEADILERIRSGEVVEPFETLRARKDGRQIIVSLTISPVRDGFGGIIGASTIARDITGHKQAEEIIRRQAQTLDQIQDAVVTTDLNGLINGWNRGAERLFACTAKEAIGRHISFVYPEDLHEYLNLEIIGPLREKGELKREVRLKRKTGEEFWALLLLSLLRDEQGEIIGMVGSSVDISEQKDAEGKIRRGQEEWEQTFDAIPDMVAVIDDNHIITKANRAMAEKMGIAREEIIGKFCHTVFHGMKKPPPYCPYDMADTTGREYYEEIFEERLQGYFLISVTPIGSPEGAVKGFVQVCRDISERKKMEERLREAAITDALTGLLNRRGFFALAEQQLRAAGRNRKGLLLLYLDIDNMKEINDRFSHKEGDQALMDTAALLKSTFRESDIIGRMGGDEFAVLLTDPSGPGIERVICGHVQGQLRHHNAQGGRPYPLSLSMGTAYYDPERPCDIADLLTASDAMMYREKKRRKAAGLLFPGVEKRLHDRVPVDSSWWAEIEGFGAADIRNVSSAGLCIATAREMTPYRTFSMRIHTPDQGEVSHEGMVMWTQPSRAGVKSDGKGFPYECGIKFIGLAAGNKNAVAYAES